MRRAAIAVAGVLALTGCDSLSRLTGGAPTPEQTCSSQETYDALTGILAGQAGSAASLLGENNALSAAASPSSFKNVLGYSAPTVEDVNKATGKITCNALLRVNTSTAGISTRGLQANDFGPDHVTFAITYSVQKTADQGRPLTTLEQAGDLASVVFQASAAALRQGQDAAAAAAQPEVEDDRAAEEPETPPEQAQAAEDPMNAMEATGNDQAGPAPDGTPIGGNQD